MTVSSQVNRKDYAGNGSTTAFATEFRFLADTSIKVIVTVDSTSVETVQTLTTDYTVSGVGDDSGGTVTMIVPPATGETLTIKRDGPLTQNTDYVENDDFPAESHEQALDKLTMNMQQQQEEIDRSLKLSEGQTSTGLTIPAPDTGKFLQWDALGNFINVDIATLGNVSLTAFGQSLINSINAAAGRLVMGSAKKVSTAVTNNVAIFDSEDEAKDSGVPFVRTGNAVGPADVITVAFAIPVTVITDKLETRVRALSNNATTTPTINYDGLGAKTIVKNGNQPLAIDDIVAGKDLILVSNTANDNVELLNPRSAFAKSFVSAEQVITPAGQLTLAHGLGVMPSIIQIRLICKAAELGYSIGDELMIQYGSTNNTGLDRGTSIVPDTSNAVIRYGALASTFRIVDKSNGQDAGATNASWRMIVRAYA